MVLVLVFSWIYILFILIELFGMIGSLILCIFLLVYQIFVVFPYPNNIKGDFRTKNHYGLM